MNREKHRRLRRTVRWAVIEAISFFCGVVLILLLVAVAVLGAVAAGGGDL